ncbi:hypothetical protein ColLi_06688 [Colletotrichum liriopes]|uniref:Uncharacterized protein n=1 Tax=Colletotrichum liriopes TaxID=708192 RepID=A0AA37GMM8_9PEZI|nr:hypothetical protein ColLi_06688 [Colletotrichum liriopes]
MKLQTDRLAALGPSHQHLGGADDDLIVVVAGVVALLDDEREENDPDDGVLGLEDLVCDGLVGAALVHERRVEGDRVGELSVGVVLGLQRREHHVLGALGAHLDGEVDGLPHHAAQL